MLQLCLILGFVNRNCCLGLGTFLTFVQNFVHRVFLLCLCSCSDLFLVGIYLVLRVCGVGAPHTTKTKMQTMKTSKGNQKPSLSQEINWQIFKSIIIVN